MAITLTIENPDALGGAGRARFEAASRSFGIGRDAGADWCLPDPSRVVSSRHCEVRFENGAYWLLDTSTNGVVVNGTRMEAPRRLADGDDLRIGPYRVRVALREAARPEAGRPEAWGPEARGADRFLAAFCRGAGIAPEALRHCDGEALARELGEFVRLAAENVTQMLRARDAARALTRSTSRTVVSAAGNNPLKHVPTASEAVEVMFARRRPGYLDARASLEEAFADLKRHELATYAAMQAALGRLLEPLSPESVEVKAGGSTAFAFRRNRAWDIYRERWAERDAGPNGMLDAFLAYFAEAYDEAERKDHDKG